MSGITEMTVTPGTTVVYRMSEDVPVEVETVKLPEIYVSVRYMMYFADSYGYLMVCEEEDALRGYVSNVKNARYADEVEFGGIIPDAWKDASEAICAALTVLHGINLDAAYDSQ